MRAVVAVAACLLAFAAVASAGDGTVLVLGQKTFNDALAEHKQMLVEFYAPWCGHCKALAPEFDTAAAELGESGTLAKVDCTTEQDLCSQFGVRGYPTLKFFSNGKPSDYEGARKSAAIVSFVEKQSRPAISDLTSEESIKLFTAKDDVALIAFFNADAEGREIFDSIANEHRNDYIFGAVKDAEVAKAYGVSTFPAVILFRNFDEPQVTMTGDLTEEGVEAFLKAESFPVLGQLGPDNYRQYIDRKLPLVNIFTDPKSDADKEAISTARTVAKEFKGKLSVVEIDGVAYQRHATSLGLSGKTPGIVIQDPVTHSKFVFDESTAISTESLHNFLKQYVDGELQPFLKSAAVPEDNNGPLYTIVGKTWSDIVINNEKDVLVEFYAPWCGHCKELAPKYEALAEQFADNENVVIAKIDSTENDAPGVEVQGFPTIMLFAKGAKSSPKTYSGDRSAAALADFIRANGATFGAGSAAASKGSEHEL